MFDWRDYKGGRSVRLGCPPTVLCNFGKGLFGSIIVLKSSAPSAVVFFQAALIAGLLFERVARKRAGAAAGRAKLETELYRENLSAHLARVHSVGEMSAAIGRRGQISRACGHQDFRGRRARKAHTDRDSQLAKVLELLEKIEEQAFRGQATSCGPCGLW